MKTTQLLYRLLKCPLILLVQCCILLHNTHKHISWSAQSVEVTHDVYTNNAANNTKPNQILIDFYKLQLEVLGQFFRKAIAWQDIYCYCTFHIIFSRDIISYSNLLWDNINSKVYIVVNLSLYYNLMISRVNMLQYRKVSLRVHQFICLILCCMFDIFTVITTSMGGQGSS